MTQAINRHDTRNLAHYLAILRQHLPELRERWGVRKLGVFGSYVRNEQHGDSDLDLLVEFDDRPLTLLQFIALENYLSDLLSIKVDLVEQGTLKPTIGRHLHKEMLTLEQQEQND